MGRACVHSSTWWMRKGWDVGPASQNSPGRRRKKNAIHMRSDVAREHGSLAVMAMAVAVWRIGRGMGMTRWGAASLLEKPFKRRMRRGSMVPVPAVCRGSRRPSMVNVCATKWSASATVPDLTGLPLAENRPSRTRVAKI